MRRYIDADALEKRVEDFEELTGIKLDIIHDFVSSEPTADVVEVVRCKDCSKQCICYHTADYFCADGDRKGEEP